MSRRVAILGAGLAGLTSAGYLAAHGWDVTVFEAGPEIAGLARSHHDTDGFTYDFGAHFITNRLAAAIGCGAGCRVVRRYGESVRLGKKTVGYPWGLLRTPRFLASAVRRRLFGRGKPLSAADWYRSTYGDALAKQVAIPLTEAWSGQPADTLSAAVGDKIPGGIAQTLFLKLAARAGGVAVAVGYCGTLPQSSSVWHVYPEGGLSSLCERLAYPVYSLDYEADRQRFAAGTGIEGLYSVGRNGEFRHILMEDVYWRTRFALRPLIENSPAAARSE